MSLLFIAIIRRNVIYLWTGATQSFLFIVWCLIINFQSEICFDRAGRCPLAPAASPHAHVSSAYD